MTAVIAVAAVVLGVVAVVSQQNPFDLNPSDSRIDIYTLSNDDGDSITCHRNNSGFTIETDNGEIRAVMVGHEGLEQCIKAYRSGHLPFDPRNFIGSYEAGYISWEGIDHENIYHWSVPDECAPHYQFKQKSHPWIVDAFGLVDTIDVTFQWTGTDAEWATCYVAREKQVDEIDLSEIEIATIDSARN